MINDEGHSPHASFIGQKPVTVVARGPYALDVELVDWGPKRVLTSGVMAAELQANWGNSSRKSFDDEENKLHVTRCFEGQTLQQILESITMWFRIDGVTRACTHQLVRTRHAAIMQHGGRDNDWRHRGWTMPETMHRACLEEEGSLPSELQSCVLDMEPISEYAEKHHGFSGKTLRSLVTDYIQQGKELYAALVDAGIPWQDARRVLHIGTQTYLFINYPYFTLKGFLGARLEHVMDWEINCVAQLMLRQVRMRCPAVMGDNLKSLSDAAKKAVFGGLTSWPPDGKWPVAEEHQNLKRTHRPEQMPFFVLHPDSMNGGEIRWIETNGTYPEMPIR